MLIGLLEDASFGPPQIYSRVFHLWNSIDLDSAWVEDSRPCQFSFLLSILALLAIRHTCVLGVVIPNDIYWAF